MGDLFGDKLKTIRVERELSQQELADLLGTSKQVISRYEKNQRTPKITVAQEYAEKLNVPLNYLIDENMSANTSFARPHILSFTSENGSTPVNAIPVPGFIKVPVVGCIPAGSPLLAAESIEGYEDVPVSWLNGDPQNYFILRVDGDSMEGARIFDGDLVLIKKCSSCESGQICAVGITGETPDLYATLKRVYELDDEHLELVPENAKYPRRKVKRSEVNIFGLAKNVYRKL